MSDSLPKRIWIVATGSRKDIQPYIAVGAAMVKRGYDVTFLTYERSAAFAEAVAGMKGVSLGKDYETQTNAKIHKGMNQGDVLLVLQGMADMDRKNAPTLCDNFLAELRESGPPDLCLATALSQYLAWYLYVHHQVPFQLVTTFAYAYNSDQMLRGLPKLPSGVTSYILHHTLLSGAHDSFKAYDEYLNANILNVFTKSKHMAFYKQPSLPMVTLSSPEFASILYSKDISTMWKFVGSTVIPSKQQVNSLDYFGGKENFKNVKDFLKAGPKPVCLGWGNMVCKSPEEMVELCCRAVAHSGQRAIVLGGSAGLSFDVLMNVNDIDSSVVEYTKENILFVEYAPHEWLFPQVAATVNHGGPGTMTAALRGGVPTVITPVFGDQFDSSYVVNKLFVGVGFAKQLQKIEWKELGDAIQKAATDVGIARRAEVLGNKLWEEDGADNAVNEMEHYWKGYCVTGKLQKVFPLPREEPKEESSIAESKVEKLPSPVDTEEDEAILNRMVDIVDEAESYDDDDATEKLPLGRAKANVEEAQLPIVKEDAVVCESEATCETKPNEENNGNATDDSTEELPLGHEPAVNMKHLLVETGGNGAGETVVGQEPKDDEHNESQEPSLEEEPKVEEIQLLVDMQEMGCLSGTDDEMQPYEDDDSDAIEELLLTIGPRMEMSRLPVDKEEASGEDFVSRAVDEMESDAVDGLEPPSEDDRGENRREFPLGKQQLIVDGQQSAGKGLTRIKMDATKPSEDMKTETSTARPEANEKQSVEKSTQSKNEVDPYTFSNVKERAEKLLADVKDKLDIVAAMVRPSSKFVNEMIGKFLLKAEEKLHVYLQLLAEKIQARRIEMDESQSFGDMNEAVGKFLMGVEEKLEATAEKIESRSEVERRQSTRSARKAINVAAIVACSSFAFIVSKRQR